MSGATTSKYTGWRLAVAAIFVLLLGLVPAVDAEHGARGLVQLAPRHPGGRA